MMTSVLALCQTASHAEVVPLRYADLPRKGSPISAKSVSAGVFVGGCFFNFTFLNIFRVTHHDGCHRFS